MGSKHRPKDAGEIPNRPTSWKHWHLSRLEKDILAIGLLLGHERYISWMTAVLQNKKTPRNSRDVRAMLFVLLLIRICAGIALEALARTCGRCAMVFDTLRRAFDYLATRINLPYADDFREQ